MPRRWGEVPWLMSPLMPTGNPNHIIEDMWLGRDCGQPGPAGRVLVSQASPSDPPDISFHLPGAAEGSKGRRRDLVYELANVDFCSCMSLWTCVSFHPALVAGDGEGVWRAPRASLGPF